MEHQEYHIHIEDLYAYADGRIQDTSKITEIKKHIQTCEFCSDIVSGVKFLREQNKRQNPQHENTFEYIREKGRNSFAQIQARIREEEEYEKKNIAEFSAHPSTTNEIKSLKMRHLQRFLVAASVALVLVFSGWFALRYDGAESLLVEEKVRIFKQGDIVSLKHAFYEVNPQKGSHIELRGANSATNQRSGIELYDDKEYEKAAQLLSQEWKENPEKSVLGMYLAMSYFGAKEHEKSEQVFEKLLKMPDFQDETIQESIQEQLKKLHQEKK